MGHHNDLTAVARSRRITTFFIDLGPIESIINIGWFYFSGFKKGGYSHAQTRGVYIDRTAGGNRYYCAFDGDIDACPSAGAETGQDRLLP